MPAPPIIDYASPKPQPSRVLTLENIAGVVRVTFGVAPKWAFFVSISACIMAALAQTAGLVAMITITAEMLGLSGIQSLPTTLRVQIAISLCLWTLSPIFWATLAIYHWTIHKRFGRVPRVLTASSEGVQLSWLGWWWIRERRWPTDQITSVELRPARGNLTPRRTICKLLIRRRTGRRLRFMLSSKDPLLPGRIAGEIKRALGMDNQHLPSAPGTSEKTRASVVIETLSARRF